jgi:bifunctional oligoribonuclease and PAP phosphatase NrnA
MSFFPVLQPAFQALLAAATGKRVAVVGHLRPDGDCIGSQVALCRVLRARGVDAVCVNPDPVPRRLQFLVGDTPFHLAKVWLPDGASADGWVSIHVDCADHGRCGKRLATAFSRPLGNIDHHLSNDGYAQHNIIDAQAAATGEILAGLFFDAGLVPDAAAAQGLYAGIATDTGQFRFPSTTHRVFDLASRVIAAGANPAAASAELYERESFAKIALLGRFLESFRRECNGRVCVGFLRRADFAETGATSEDTEGLVDYARSIEGVDIGVLIEERPDGMKASLRAKDPVYRLDQVAVSFNGGGHACAAGLNVPGDLASFYPALIAALTVQLANVDARRASAGASVPSV